MAKWYVKRGDQVIGPVEVQQIRNAVTSGRLRPTDLLANDAAGPWVQADQTDAFRQIAPQQAMPPAKPMAAQPAIPIATPTPTVELPAAPKRTAAMLVVSTVGRGIKTTAAGTYRAIAVWFERRHQIKIAKIQADALRPSSPAAQAPQYIQPPQNIVQSTVVKIVNKNSGGCGCSGCGSMILMIVLALIAVALYPSIKKAIEARATTSAPEKSTQP